MWITDDDLKAAAGIRPADTYDDAWISRTVDAANALVARLRPDITDPTDPLHADVRQGATELALKLYRSRGATDDGTGSYDLYNYAARYLDANVRLLLGIDRPVIA